MTRIAIDSPVRRQRDRLFVAAAETLLHEPSVSAIYVVLPADAVAGPTHPMQVIISASASRPKRVPAATTHAGRAATPSDHHHFRWFGTLMNETDGLR